MSVSDYAVVYDVSDDHERRHVDKVLKGFGFRIQKSVFECRLTKRGKEDLISKLKGVEIKTGFIKLYRLEYINRSISIGEMQKCTPDSGPAFIV